MSAAIIIRVPDKQLWVLPVHLNFNRKRLNFCLRTNDLGDAHAYVFNNAGLETTSVQPSTVYRHKLDIPALW